MLRGLHVLVSHVVVSQDWCRRRGSHSDVCCPLVVSLVTGVCVCVRKEVKVSDCFTPYDQPLTLFTSKKVGSVTKLLLG